MRASDIALSFGGGGHLLPYHLVVGEALATASTKGRLPRLRAVSGSSAGAIAAVLIARSPQLVLDYATRFIATRGNALKDLESIMCNRTEMKNTDGPALYICTTRCKDGSVHLFDANELENTAELMKCVRASCTIPKSFHPYDVITKGGITYPDSDGILIRGDYYCDGGIAGPAPPVPGFERAIVISPISGSSKDSHRISPEDSSFSLWGQLECRGSFHVRPSIQNLRALRVASGLTTSTELRSWYEQGIHDANEFVGNWELESLGKDGLE